MVAYPVRVPRNSYGGWNESKRRKRDEENSIAEKLEKYINKKIEDSNERVQTFLYGEIACDTGYPRDIVEKILYGVDAGGNGFTVVKNK